MNNAPDPDDLALQLEGMHAQAILALPEDYRAGCDLIVRPFWRSGTIRREFLILPFLRILLWTGLGGALVFGIRLVDAPDAAAELRRLAPTLPISLAIIIGIPAAITALIGAAGAWELSRFRRFADKTALAMPELPVAWDRTRFGIVNDGQLFAWPYAELLAWQETADHMFLVTREHEILIPIRRDRVEPGALAILRDGLTAAGLPGFWTYAEAYLLRRLKGGPPPDTASPA